VSQDYDVVIVGSGAGGSAVALGLARAGARVLVLEAGPRFDPSKYGLDRTDWELFRVGEARADKQDRYTFAELQPLDSRWDTLRSWSRVRGLLNRSERRRGYSYSHVRGVGGSTLHFSGEAHRLNPASMSMRTRFGIAADWPFSYTDLEPWYEEAERIQGVAGTLEGGMRPRRRPYPLPAHRLSYASSIVIKETEALDLHWEPNSLAITSEVYDGRPPCNYCGNCNRGCPRGDKGSADVTFMRHALASGKCTLLTDSPVTFLEAGKDSRVSRVHYRSAGGVTMTVSARVVVLACGAVETPRLLLLSRGSWSPEGLANEGGLVGRNFMETIAWQSQGVHETPLGSHRGVSTDLISWRYNWPDSIPGVIGGCRFTVSNGESLLGPIACAQRLVPGWGVGHKKAMRATFGRTLAIGAIGESLPNASTYVDLDPNKKDTHGLPLPRIHSFLAAGEIDRLLFMATKVRSILAAAGAGEVVHEFGNYDFFNSTHVFGTCRMGTDPADSVVDSTGQAHAWRNLYVADASVFPSSGGGESPSLTIQALALRTADAIIRRMGHGEL
jgi:choline dehydrogenase-like flavoprotein